MKVRHFDASEPVKPLLLRDAYVFVMDSQGGRLLEYNPIEVAGIAPLGGPAFCKREIALHIARHAADQRDVITYSAEGLSRMYKYVQDALGNCTEAIMLPYYSGDACWMDEATIERRESSPDLLIVNASRKHQALFMNKGAKAEIAKLADATAAEPFTVNYRNSFMDLDTEIQRAVNDFKGREFVVIKPENGKQGEGVVVVPYEQLGPVLRLLMKGNDSNADSPHIDRFAEKYWRKNGASIFQVQEFVQANSPVHHKGRDWNATTRLVWSVLVGADAKTGEETMLIKLHGGTYKLPRRDVHNHGFLMGMFDSAIQGFAGDAKNTEVSQKNVISYSYGHSILESAFSFITKKSGRGEHFAIKDPAALAREGELIAKDIEATFNYLESHSYADVLQQIATNSKVGEHIVAHVKNSYPVKYVPPDAIDGQHPPRPQPAA